MKLNKAQWSCSCGMTWGPLRTICGRCDKPKPKQLGRPRLGVEPSELVSLRFPGETIKKMTEKYGSPEEAIRQIVNDHLFEE